ncbi:MAG: hypothetical protein ACRDHE_16020, partial [Ktedonobacterales bacterium]
LPRPGWTHTGGGIIIPNSRNLATTAAKNCAHAVATEPPGADWISVTSSAPSDIAADMESGGLAMMESRLGPVTLDAPTLVYPLNVHTGYDANDCPHWIASFHYNSGGSWGAIDYVFDPAHSQMRFVNGAGIYQNDSRFGKTFPYITLEQALALVHQQRGVTAAKSETPLLVFFSLKQGWAGEGQPPDTTTSHVWTDSGTSATDPMWRIVGSDGNVYFVVRSLRVYAMSEVPTA